jgi:hypothetical protein
LYDILLKNVTNTHEYEELVKIFLRPGEYRISSEDDGSRHDFIFNGHDDKNITKEDIYDTLSELTGMKPPWGIVTGIRPVKMTGEIMESLGSFEKTRERLTGYYRINEEKADKAIMMYDYQQRTAGKAAAGFGEHIYRHTVLPDQMSVLFICFQPEGHG